MGCSARSLVPGEARGEALVLGAPLSFWGGYDPQTGRIIDRSHPQHGETAARRILVLPGGRGSSSSSSVLAEALRLGTAPAGIVLGRPDGILLVGMLVARELYGGTTPLVVAGAEFLAAVRTGDHVRITGDGTLWIDRRGKEDPG